MDAQREIADRGDDRLQESDRDEQQPTAHIALAWRVPHDVGDELRQAKEQADDDGNRQQQKQYYLYKFCHILLQI